MKIKHISPDFAVSEQVAPGDCAALAAAGFGTLINNRPDAEVGPDLQSAAMQAAAEAAGLRYVANPVVMSELSMTMVEAQAAAIAEAEAPVFAYCRSGTRSTLVWALAQAGKMDTADILSAAAEAGYDLSAYSGQIEALAAQKSTS
ncbi:MAG: TIGR01244 family sulfur transferase [Pseudomonadota bacterium]